MDIKRFIDQLRFEWSQPHRRTESDLTRPDFELACRFAPDGADRMCVESTVGDVPEELQEFWEAASWAELFKDEEFGQWGLRILTPEESSKETSKQIEMRPEDFIEGDLVLGRFFGDSDLLVIRCDRSKSDFGTVLISLPIDPRSDWYVVSNSFKEFLCRYALREGLKFWEAEALGN